MPQPIKKNGTYQKPRSKTVKKPKSTVSTSRGSITKKVVTKKNVINKVHPKFGTSKLEERFENDFLIPLGVKYEKQFEAKGIGRFYDFAIYTPMGSLVLLEIDGTYWHGYGLLHEEKNYVQKKEEWADKQKTYWAGERGIPLYHIWEHDINNNPQKVKDLLNQILNIENKKDDKKKRH